MWTYPSDLSGIDDFSYILDDLNNTIPDKTVDTSNPYTSYDNVVDGIWYFHLRAKDNAGNWGNTSHRRINVDSAHPSITNVVANPMVQQQDGYVNISCKTTDSLRGINNAKVIITYPNDAQINATLINIPGTNKYYYHNNYSIIRNYTYYICTKDVAGNQETSAVHNFSIEQNVTFHTFQLSSPWSLITLPVENNYTASSLLKYFLLSDNFIMECKRAGF